MKRIITLALALVSLLSGCDRAETGVDVRRTFAEARDGKPLRCVFFGGSITQSGDGWVGNWLRQQFPKSPVSIINSGMSATGSALGVFRLERDVIAYQPDLVAIEFCVNDAAHSDEEVIRYMETMVVRLKKLPHPPAIVILEAAAKGGMSFARHRRVARHYHLLEVDLQQAVDTRLKETGAAWGTYFSDNVHPNAAGNSLYEEAISRALEPYASRTGSCPLRVNGDTLPAPISSKPLLLDARMVPITNFSTDWKRENTLPFWWDRFFLGVLSADAPGSTLTLPVRGSTFGLYYAMDKSYGTFFASVDEALPTYVATNSRGGYNFCLVGQDLVPGEHRLHVVLPSKEASPASANLNGVVKLGYLLVAGENRSTAADVTSGLYKPERLAMLHYTPLLPVQWNWSGPYGFPVQPGNKAAQARDALALMTEAFAPENNGAKIDWNPLMPTESTQLDFYKLTGSSDPAVAYAVTEIQSTEARDVIVALSCDYYAKVWLNGELLTALNTAHGSPQEQILIPARLQPGSNRLLIKVGAGSGGFNFSAGIWR